MLGTIDSSCEQHWSSLHDAMFNHLISQSIMVRDQNRIQQWAAICALFGWVEREGEKREREGERDLTLVLIIMLKNQVLLITIMLSKLCVKQQPTSIWNPHSAPVVCVSTDTESFTILNMHKSLYLLLLCFEMFKE